MVLRASPEGAVGVCFMPSHTQIKKLVVLFSFIHLQGPGATEL
jgi:hypothetical protein